jgi:4-amino-4-deoxy-L-arabinose transferase-like glycosyltransferase
MNSRLMEASFVPLFMRVWWLSLSVKLILAAIIPLLSDEAYYWVWSHDPQLSYFDHPPVVAWLFWLGHPLEGLGQAIRWPAVILAHLSLLFWPRILGKEFTSSGINLWICLCILNPMTGLGSIVVTPDLPLIFAWSAALYFYSIARLSDEVSPQIGLGLALGLGFMSKYNMVIFGALILWDYTRNSLWNGIRIRNLLLTVAVAAVAALPVWIWNFQHEFDSFLFQTRHGLGGSSFNIQNSFSYMGEQFFILFPSVALALFFKRSHQEPRWLSIWAAGPLVFFLISSLRGRVEANWPLVAYPSMMALAVARYTDHKWLRRTNWLWLGAALVVVSQVMAPWIPAQPGKLKTHEFVVYDHLLPVAKEFRPFYASSFQMAATLTYKLKEPILKLNGVNRRDYYDYKTESRPTGEYFYLAARYHDTLPQWLLESYEKVFVKDLPEGLSLYKFERISTGSKSDVPDAPEGGAQ